MKKIFTLLLALFLSNNIVTATSFEACEMYYNDQKYNTASYCFAQLLNIDSNNVQARFYYAASLFFDKQYEASYQQ